ncbi:MAG: S8 family serine peptidase [Tepidibacter sp.]|jgi:hypothetical protein|uniref:S8 family serine peptidase n=1 Tax=Tepidibacter sp. TaxID=2529387 RepID=UPI0025F4F048|nr:S8 family serine peptidase [Tepidibacter sp.]MCT4508890.1 S8 family serine peptidase [Tepidibacter sp.]
MNRKINIAIIDDGINEKIFCTDINKKIEIRDRLVYEDNNLYGHTITHGTLCAGVINKYSDNININSIKILNDNRGDINSLVEALEWCINNDIRVVNISLGTYYLVDEVILKYIINKCYRKNVIIVAASDNHDYLTFPASFGNVIGVKGKSSNLLRKNKYSFFYNLIDGIDILAYSTHELIDLKNRRIICPDFNSFAVPYITALVANILYKETHLTFNQIKNKLFLNSVKNIDKIENIIRYKTPNCMENVLIYYVDCKKNTNSIYPFNAISEQYISNIEELFNDIKKNYYNIDTIIIIAQFIKKYDLKNIYIECKRYNINLVIISKYIKFNNLNNEDIHVWCNEHIKHIINNLIYKESAYDNYIPSVCIYVDDSLDLIDICLKIKEKFMENGYNALLASDILESEIYSIDYLPIDDDVSKKNIEKYIQTLSYKKNSDIVFYCTYQKESLITQDITIKLNCKNDSLFVNINEIEKPIEGILDFIEYIYKYIFDNFS